MRRKIFLLTVAVILVILFLVYRFNLCNYYPSWVVDDSTSIKSCKCFGVIIKVPTDYLYDLFKVYDAPTYNYCLGIIQEQRFLNPAQPTL